ncbi:partial N-acetylglucosaminyldiphosphoundecaprenol N-acetyl-beta-D-mannosaminyltransferase, partial [biofilm metagenome]
MDADKDFSRNVWCLLGLPFDAIDLNQSMAEILSAINDNRSCFLSTPNLNFLCASQTEAAFRESVINSDLSIADGFPIVVVAKLLGIPLPERVAGSDLIDHLYRHNTDKPVKVFFFGGAPGVGELACKAINQQSAGLQAVGYFAPGFGSIEEMGSPDIIANINQHQADFLIVALGAQKGQAWIENNKDKINAPVISHLGAVINFFAGTVARAPTLAQRFGLEWLWRIYQEPALWRRYYNDGLKFMKLFICNVLPYWYWLTFKRGKINEQPLSIIQIQKSNKVNQLIFSGSCTIQNYQELTSALKKAASVRCNTVIDLTKVTVIDSAFLGLCLVLYKHLKASGCTLLLTNPNNDVKRI